MTRKIKKIAVYLDFATIPSLNYFLHFAEHYEDKETIRLFGLGRFTIPDRLISKYPEGIIRFYPIAEHNMNPIFSDLGNILSQGNANYELELHLNLCHSDRMMTQFLITYAKYEKYIDQVKLYLYDDGAEGIVRLDRLANQDSLPESIKFERKQMSELFNARTLSMNGLTRYFWRYAFPTEYYLLNRDILENQRLYTLKREMGAFKQIDMDAFAKLNDVKKAIIFDILDLNLEKIEKIKTVFENKKTYLFLGTTLYNISEEEHKNLIELHCEMIRQFFHSEGQFFRDKTDYLFFYKGHPNEKAMTLEIANKLSYVNVFPDNVPMEVLIWLGIIPTYIGGFASSALFNIPKERIGDIIFFTKKDDYEQNEVYSSQYRLMKLLLNLGYLSSDKAHILYK